MPSATSDGDLFLGQLSQRAIAVEAVTSQSVYLCNTKSLCVGGVGDPLSPRSSLPSRYCTSSYVCKYDMNNKRGCEEGGKYVGL